MKEKSYTPILDLVQKPITELLRSIGFKKKGRTYNRIVEDGLIQVVNFQMGEFPIGNYVIPRIRESYYGKYTVNLGAFIPCVAKREVWYKEKLFRPEYECQIRERLTILAYGKDSWWSLDTPPQATGETVAKLMSKFGIPFLDRYGSYASILNEYDKNGNLPFRNEGRSMLDVAIIYHYLGQFESAKKYFIQAAENAESSGHTAFREYVDSTRIECGL